MGKAGPPADRAAQEQYYSPHKDSAEARFTEMQAELTQMEADLRHAQQEGCCPGIWRRQNDRVWRKRVDLMHWHEERWGSFKY